MGEGNLAPALCSSDFIMKTYFWESNTDIGATAGVTLSH